MSARRGAASTDARARKVQGDHTAHHHTVHVSIRRAPPRGAALLFSFGCATVCDLHHTAKLPYIASSSVCTEWPHFGQACGWQARQKGLPQDGHGP